MAIYLCRWPNGEFSIVNAKTKGEAIELLDEWGNAEQAFLTRMTDCMFDFRLGDDGQIELADIGGSTHDCIMETCYPELNKASDPRVALVCVVYFRKPPKLPQVRSVP